MKDELKSKGMTVLNLESDGLPAAYLGHASQEEDLSHCQ